MAGANEVGLETAKRQEQHQQRLDEFFIAHESSGSPRNAGF